ncbi:MAG TPA: hypothetical protein VMB80_12110 [Candidatus Acidoferrum sp.]|nr:hypothetical protein [Candidatus Acidoferrum sp.]
MKSTPYRFRIAALLIAGLSPAVLMALVIENPQGTWPTNWPKELEPFRVRSRTVELAAGNQENVYEIPLTNRADFERVWPSVLQLKSPGAPITLYATNNPSTTFFHNNRAAIRIFAPPDSGPIYPTYLACPPQTPETAKENQERLNQLLSEGKIKILPIGPPWPGDIVSTNGELPEYVSPREENGVMRWIPGDFQRDLKENGFGEFYYRARVDLELVVDGQIVDLNSIQFPTNAPIHDKRPKN